MKTPLFSRKIVGRVESLLRFYDSIYKPVWRNGRRKGLKILCWQQRVGSNPTTGTKILLFTTSFFS